MKSTFDFDSNPEFLVFLFRELHYFREDSDSSSQSRGGVPHDVPAEDFLLVVMAIYRRRKPLRDAIHDGTKYGPTSQVSNNFSDSISFP
jgi:hypothetical protein